MAESATTDTHAEHHGPSTQSFLAVFGALVIFTALSFVANTAARSEAITVQTSFILILGIAVLKALLVAAWFMHLRWDWPRVYIMIVPALILGPLLVIVLLPDIVLAWKHAAGG